MKDLSILQKYMVCTVNEKGVFPFASVEERILGLVAAGLLSWKWKLHHHPRQNDLGGRTAPGAPDVPGAPLCVYP